MDTTIKINKPQAEMLQMIMYPIIQAVPVEESDVKLLYFCLQGVLSELSERFDRINFKGNKPKNITLSLSQFHALMYSVSQFQSNDPWINANLLDIADKMHRKYVDVTNLVFYSSFEIIRDAPK
jgi:hypothetical protein